MVLQGRFEGRAAHCAWTWAGRPSRRALSRRRSAATLAGDCSARWESAGEGSAARFLSLRSLCPESWYHRATSRAWELYRIARWHLLTPTSELVQDCPQILAFFLNLDKRR